MSVICRLPIIDENKNREELHLEIRNNWRISIEFSRNAKLDCHCQTIWGKCISDRGVSIYIGFSFMYTLWCEILQGQT